jgi:hypothetical protein
MMDFKEDAGEAVIDKFRKKACTYLLDENNTELPEEMHS